MASSTATATETRHQLLQWTLGERERGGPHEQRRPKPLRLQGTRSCEILHSSLQEPLAHWKSLESAKPHWPATFRRYHLNHGIRVIDHDTAVVSARDTVRKTSKGLVRSSSGSVTYSQTHAKKVELDVQELAHILGDGVPGGGHAWTPSRLEAAFKERTGRPGSWAHYDLAIHPFLLLFPRTFEPFGRDHAFVRLCQRRNTLLLDHVEEAVARLARAREHGCVQAHPSVPNAVAREVIQLPQLKTHRLKAVFVSHARPALEEEGYDSP